MLLRQLNRVNSRDLIDDGGTSILLNLNEILMSHILVPIFFFLKFLFFLWEMKLDACVLVPLSLFLFMSFYPSHLSLSLLSTYLFCQHLRCCLVTYFVKLLCSPLNAHDKSIPFPLPYIPHSQRWLPTLHTCVDSSLTLVLNISFDETPSPSSLPPNISNYHHSPPTIPSSNALSHTLTQVRLSTIRSYPSKLVPRSQHIFREWGKVRKPEDTFLTFHHLTWITTWVVTFMWG